MASLIEEQRGSKTHYRVQWLSDRKKYRLRLGAISEDEATFAFRHIDALIGAKAVGMPIPSETLKWLHERTGDRLRDQLADAGLCNKRKRTTIDAFIDAYIQGRKDAAANTVRNWRNSQQKLKDFFGDRDFHEITEGDADDWRQGLVNAGLSRATISKAVKHAKQFAAAAVRKGYLISNPFRGLIAGGEEDPERQAFIDRKTIAKVLKTCPDDQWRLIVALCRFGGLRCPSEVLSLKWTDIDWERSRFTVTCAKTKRYGKGLRIVPLFPELEPYLSKVFHAADPGDFVITRYRQRNCNLRTQFERILRRASVEPWERLFHNLRSSRQTELENQWPTHVVCQWLGNNESTARKSYLQTTEDHYRQAVNWGTHRGTKPALGDILGDRNGRNQNEDNRKKTPRKTRFVRQPRGFLS